MKKNWLKILIYISLVFLVIFLVKIDLFQLPSVLNPGSLVVAVFLLFASFFVLSVQWVLILKRSGMPVSYRSSTVSCALTVFAKYIPGKVLMVVGKTGYIQKKYGYKLDGIVTASINDQLISIWVGLFFGMFSFWVIDELWLFVLTLTMWGLFGVFVFTSFFHTVTSKLIKKIIGKDFNIKPVPFKHLFKLFPIYLLFWIILGAGFYFLIHGFYNVTISLIVVCVFPLSAVLGIISVVSPGGLGVREFVLGSFFSFLISTEIGVQLAIIGRLWFIVGEVLFFLSGLVGAALNRH